jgi:alkyl sulfatase BDS1-like metallo-beta-lactamase superfamily hydrolase
LASVFEKLAFGSENGTWRNFYLTGAQDLRSGQKAPTKKSGMTGLNLSLSVEQLFDWLAVNVDGERAASDRLAITFHVGDAEHRLNLSNGALTHHRGGNLEADLSITVLDKKELVEVLQGANIGVKEGNGKILQRLMSLVGMRGESTL